MRLSLVVPGLLWPEPVLSDTVRGLRLPALETLLGKGRVNRQRPFDEGAFWDGLFGTPAPAAAPLRLLEGGHEADGQPWACLDPVSLIVDQQGIRLDDPAKLDFTRKEQEALYQAIAPLLADFLPLSFTNTGWHLRLDQSAALPPFPPLLAPLVGQPARDLLPPGDEGKPWRRLLNEIQMTLHDHPLNQARTAEGKAVITSFVLWGAGSLPANEKAEGQDFTVASDSAILRGRAWHAGATAEDMPERYGEWGGEEDHHLVIHHNGLEVPTRLRDALEWRQALEHMEEAWIAPALKDLAAGGIDSFSLHGFGEDSSLEVSVNRHTRWKFWRRPALLTELHP